MTLLAVVAAASLLGCNRNIPPQPESVLQFDDATLRIIFKEPLPVTYTGPVAKCGGIDSDGTAFHHRGTMVSGATNDQNLVGVNWEQVGRTSWERGDVYFFVIRDGKRPEDKAQHLVLYTGNIQEVVDTDRVSITIGPKMDVEQSTGE